MSSQISFLTDDPFIENTVAVNAVVEPPRLTNSEIIRRRIDAGERFVHVDILYQRCAQCQSRNVRYNEAANHWVCSLCGRECEVVEEKEHARFAECSNGGLMRMAHGKKRRGYALNTEGIDSMKMRFHKEPDAKKASAAERYANNLRNHAKYIIKNLHPNLWPELRKEAESITEFALSVLVSACADEKDGYGVWKRAPELGLPHIEGHKTMTITSCKPPDYLGDLSSRIKECLDKKENFSHHWHSDYDYHVEGKLCDDGAYRAWLSQEFKDCGNGHYWLLISENHAIFCEND